MVTLLNAVTIVVMIDFIIYPLLAGIALAFITGPLGCFVVWKRMSYFGDTLSHSALLGIALALYTKIHISAGIIVVGCVIAVSLFYLEKQKKLSTDTLLGILSHGSLALGIISISFYSSERINLQGFLFGDFLTINASEAAVIAGLAIVITAAITRFWKPLLAVTTDEDLAKVEGRNVDFYKLLLFLSIAVVIGASINVVGVLLISALLIIPSATSRKLASSPEAMVVVSSFISIVSIVLGLLFSLYIDTPPGPSVILVSLCLFILVSLIRVKR